MSLFCKFPVSPYSFEYMNTKSILFYWSQKCFTEADLPFLLSIFSLKAARISLAPFSTELHQKLESSCYSILVPNLFGSTAFPDKVLPFCRDILHSFFWSQWLNQDLEEWDFLLMDMSSRSLHTSLSSVTSLFNWVLWHLEVISATYILAPMWLQEVLNRSSLLSISGELLHLMMIFSCQLFGETSLLAI